MSKIHRILGQLKSWESGYIAPSAAILMRDAHDLIGEQQQAIEALDASLEEAREQIKALKAQLDGKPIKRSQKK